MTALARVGWRTVTLGEFADYVDGKTDAPAQTFLLTFDDGYASLAETAYPVLADLGFTATTFLITEFVGKPNAWDVQYTWRPMTHLDWPAIEHWKARGFDFGSHGATHRRLTWLDDDGISDELHRSSVTLVERLGADAGLAVAYPFGATDGRVISWALVHGYYLGFAGSRGDAQDPFNLPRNPVYMWDCGDRPFGLRDDPLGAVGRGIAGVANRCSVGTSWMLRLRGVVSGES
ncbi:MAG: polysaccharide deacetylase family protein [Gemmatimonadetes bacterium]|nr:polysaccharide deacetylase family protein [Gemmatimonadota bacterium]